MKDKNVKKTLTGITVLVLVSLIAIFSKNILTNLGASDNKEVPNEVKYLQENKNIIDIINHDLDGETKGPIPVPEKIAYITIDDGPSKYTEEILDILDRNNIQGTFFMLNDKMKANPDAVKRIEEEGHSIGFHSVTHDIEKLYETPEATLAEFETCNETYKSITGESSKLIRLPYGSKPYMPQESYDMLLENNYKVWDWNLDTEDWKSTTDQIVSNILYYGRNKDEIVVLIHEKEQSVESLNNIIRILRERGYEILPITEEIEPKNFFEENLK